MNKKGFTLIEILVTIAILGLLSAIAIVSYQSSLKRGRDSKRMGDMDAVQKAFEQYYIDNGSYDAVCASMTPGYLQGGIPEDPKDGTYANETCAAGGYCFCASLEVLSGNSQDSSCDFSGTNHPYYCVTNIQ